MTGDLGYRIYVPGYCTVVLIHASVGTAPVGSDVTVVVYDNGVAGMTATIAAGTYVGTLVLTQAVAVDHYFTCNVTAVGSTSPGEGLVVQVRTS